MLQFTYNVLFSGVQQSYMYSKVSIHIYIERERVCVYIHIYLTLLYYAIWDIYV